MQARSEIKALSWDPRIPHAQRGHFEEQGCTGLDEEFFIYERDNKGDRLSAGNRNFYYPVWYIEPWTRTGRLSALTWDRTRCGWRHWSGQGYGKPTATERIMLVQDGKPTFGVLVFSPLFAEGLPATTVAERRMALQGFTVEVFNMEKLLLAALGKTRRLAFP